MPRCNKRHTHNTAEGVDKCNFKYAEKSTKRKATGFTWPEKRATYSPAKVVNIGPFRVAVFQEGSKTPYKDRT